MKKTLFILNALLFTSLVSIPLTSCNKSGEVEEKLTKLTLSASKTTLEIDEELTLEVSGNISLDNITLLWESSDTSVLSVTQKGKIIALKAGTSNVTVSADGIKSNAITITVKEEEIPVELVVSLTSPTVSKIKVGDTYQLVFSVTGNTENLPLEFISSNEEVISISELGLATALSEGSAEIYLKVGEKESSHYTFEVVSAFDEPTGIKVLNGTTISIGVDEEITINANVLPETASQAYEVISEDEDFVSVNGITIIGRKATTEPVNVIVKVNDDIKETISVTVLSAKDRYLSEIQSKLNVAMNLEKTMAISGHFNLKTCDLEGNETGHENYEFNVFNDRSEVVIDRKSSSNSITRYSYFKDEANLIKVNEEYNSASSSYSISEYGVTRSTYTEDAVDFAVSTPHLGNNDNTSSKGGFAYYILHSYFDTSALDGTYGKITKITYKDNVYNVIGSYGYTTTDLNLTLTFNDNGLLTSVSGTLGKYGTDYDTDRDVLESKISVDGVLEFGTREDAPSDRVKLSDMYCSDFTPTFYSGYSTSKVTGTEFSINTNIYFEISSATPSTWNKNVDPITITAVSEPEKVEISSLGNYIKAKEAIDDLEVTLSSSKGVTKVAHLSFKASAATSIKFKNLYNFGFGGDKIDVSKFTVSPTSASTSISYTLSENTCDAVLSVENDKTYVTLGSTKGSVVVTAIDSISGLSDSATLECLGSTDEEILDFIFSKKMKISVYYSGTSNNFSFTRDEGKLSGKLVGDFTYENIDYDECVSSFNTTWTFSGGVFTVAASNVKLTWSTSSYSRNRIVLTSQFINSYYKEVVGSFSSYIILY